MPVPAGGDLTLYIDLDSVKSDLKIEPNNTDRDARLTRAIAAACRKIDGETGRRFYLDAAASARTYSPRGRVVPTEDGEVLLVDDIGSTADLIVEIGDGHSWSTLPTTAWDPYPDNAIVQRRPVEGILRRSGCWRSVGSISRARVTTRWGWPIIPDPVEQAAQILAIRYFGRKDSPEGVIGSTEWGAIRLSRSDPDVYALIQEYVLPGFGG